jgi:serine/threonine protein kinase
MAKIHHPACLSIVAFDAPVNGPFCIVAERMPHNLMNLITDCNRGWAPVVWTNTITSIIAFGTAVGMAYLHSHNIVHRDLKPVNVLVDTDLHPRIGGFDISTILPLGRSSKMDHGGTPLYTAPEVVSREECGYPADVYSYGILLYELVTGNPAFPVPLPTEQLLECIRTGRHPEMPRHVSEFYSDLIERCWQIDPSKRPTFRDILGQADGFRLEADNYLAFDVYRDEVLNSA